MARPSAISPQNQYWNQLVEVKAASAAIRLYRDKLARWVRALEVFKAIASSGAIAGWAVWKGYPLVWASIIAISQFLDAVKGIFPFARQHRAASDLAIALEIIWIDADAEWAEIYSGEVRDREITKRLSKLRKLQLDAERRHFPEGLNLGATLKHLAERETEAYIAVHYLGASRDEA